jgi:hypothetical protein
MFGRMYLSNFLEVLKSQPVISQPQLVHLHFVISGMFSPFIAKAILELGRRYLLSDSFVRGHGAMYGSFLDIINRDR